MPDTNDTTTSPNTDNLVKATLTAKAGKATLNLDMRALYAYLDSIGVERDTYYARYANMPSSNGEIDTNNHKIQAKLLLSWDGDAERGVKSIDVGRYYSTPPTRGSLQKLAESLKDLVPAIVLHYQPVEISISIVGKRAPK